MTLVSMVPGTQSSPHQEDWRCGKLRRCRSLAPLLSLRLDQSWGFPNFNFPRQKGVKE